MRRYIPWVVAWALAISGVGITRFLFFRPIGAWSSIEQIDYCIKAAAYGTPSSKNYEERIFDICVAKGWSEFNPIPQSKKPPKQEPLFDLPPLTPEMLDSMEPVSPKPE